MKDSTTEELKNKILELKAKRDAVILAHNYQIEEVQDIADFLGDSLDLSRKAAEAEASVIVFCGVLFMAETASVLSPEKIILLPDKAAGCPLADMITSAKLLEYKDKYPNATVVCYINSPAEVKALSDICCTSANAVKVTESVSSSEVLFVPDQNLGDFVASKVSKKVYLYPGFCAPHQHVFKEDILKVKSEHPQALIAVHPECTREVKALADFIGGTGQILKFTSDSKNKEFIIGTEVGMLYRLSRENPGKNFYLASPRLVCPNMKLITLEKIYWSLKEMTHQIKVSPETANRARHSIEKMLLL